MVDLDSVGGFLVLDSQVLESPSTWIMVLALDFLELGVLEEDSLEVVFGEELHTYLSHRLEVYGVLKVQNYQFFILFLNLFFMLYFSCAKLSARLMIHWLSIFKTCFLFYISR